MLQSEITTVSSVEQIGYFEDEYVYDIGMKNTNQPWFFANDILVHNSVFFSAYPVLRDEIARGEISWSKETVIALYDVISEQVSDTFADFAHETFNVPKKLGQVIRAGREVVGTTGLFTTKKRYAILIYDKEGQRKDIKDPNGALKITGLDLRRSDTPKLVQEFLKDVLWQTLCQKSEEEIIDYIRAFKKEFGRLKPWQKGSPKAVNNLSRYRGLIEKATESKLKGIAVSLSVPGHVTASLNWNTLRDRHNDMHTMRIVDGQKVVVCQLKQNNDLRMSSVAYPVDEPHLPDWFTSLPFDEKHMEEVIVNKKIHNLLNVLNWDLERTSPDIEHMEQLFDFK